MDKLTLISTIEKAKLDSTECWHVLLTIYPDQSIAGVTPTYRGVYDPTVVYWPGQSVDFESIRFVCKANSFAVLPSADSTRWAPVLRFVRGPESVTYKGDTYLAFNFMIPEPQEKANGELPTVQLILSNVQRVIQGYLEIFEGGVGAKVELRIVSSADMLGDPSEYYEFEVTESQADQQSVTFTLGADNPMRQLFPRGMYLENHCNKVFNAPSMQASLDPRGCDCGYTGTDTSCTRVLEDCRAKGNVANFGGCPGISDAGFRAAGIV